MVNDPVGAADGAGEAAPAPRTQAGWYPISVAVFGLVSIVLVTLVPLFEGVRSLPITGTLVLVVVAFTIWRYKQPVQPVSDVRIAIWVLIWFVLFQLVAWVGGPDLGGRNVPLWAALGVLTALPPFIEAGLCLRRSRT